MNYLKFYTATLVVSMVALFTTISCNQIEDPEGITNAPNKQLVFEHNNPINNGTGSLILNSDSTFSIAINNDTDGYITGAGQYTNFNLEIKLTFNSLSIDNEPKTNVPFTITAPYVDNKLFLNYPYDQVLGAKIFNLIE